MRAPTPKSSALLLALLLGGPPLAAQAAGGSGAAVSLRLGIAGGRGLCGAALVPGVEVRTPGRLHAVGVLDAYLTPSRDRDDCRRTVGPTGTERFVAAPTSPPRLRLGAGWTAGVGEASAEARAYVGQQGVVEGFDPLVGAGLAVGRGAWAVGVDGTLHRAPVFEEVPFSGGGPTTREAGTEWVPSVELAARFEVGRWGGSGGAGAGVGRPVLWGIGGGTLGALAGGLAAVPFVRACEGDEVCAIPLFIGAALGESMGTPLGVHLAEGRRGSYPLAALASVGIAAAGVSAASLLSDKGAQAVTVMVPAAQLAASVFIERRTAR